MLMCDVNALNVMRIHLHSASRFSPKTEMVLLAFHTQKLNPYHDDLLKARVINSSHTFSLSFFLFHGLQ